MVVMMRIPLMMEVPAWREAVTGVVLVVVT